MSLRDRLRGNRSAEQEEEIGPGGDAPPDPIDFRPRFDGAYASAAGSDDGLILRFAPGTVSETAARIPDGAGEGTATGEYTASGRVVVQRPFGRPIVYTVLALTDDGFTARRTDTNPGGGGSQVTFAFQT
jgi:hypothetical protein